jgi:octaprenyl-diphosphate synthase
MTLESRDMQWLDILSETARRMARGELLQAARSRRVDMTEDDYLVMIGDKTAALFSAACRLGGLTSSLNKEQITGLGVYGEQLGIAFQIKDDLLDIFGSGGLIGKPIGGDLKERKLTLPLLHSLGQAPPRQASRIRARIRRGVKRGEIKDITQFIKETGGDKYAERKMDQCRVKALEGLEQLPDLPARGALKDLIEFAVTRGS